jgi:tRNA dimethylallyltransferase
VATPGPLIAVVGETASGKSGVALALAQRFDGEIVAADSWTVYRGFDIGTAKPSPTDQAAVKHHLIDIKDASDGFNAALFKQLAEAAIEDITNREKLPILVGGTALYIDSVLYDFSFRPAGSPELRQQRNTMTIDELLAEIAARGISSEGIDIRNKRRLIRLLEAEGERPVKGQLRPNTLIVGLRVPREQLRERIEQRVDSMLAAGLETEVRNLSEKYGWDVEPMKGIGYREWREYFQGTQNLTQIRQRIISNTIQKLAKRQRSWFGSNSSVHWCNYLSQIVDLATSFLNK